MLAKAVTMMAVVAPAFGMVVDHKAERQAMIDEINETPGITWKAAMNERFRDLPLGSSKSLIGARAPTAEEIANMDGMVVVPADAQHESGLTAADIPQDFDSRTGFPKCAKVIGDIRDQSMCGCCWAFAGASAASDRMCIATKGAIAVPLSAQDVCFCASYDGCQGGQIDTPWSHISSDGAVTGGQVNNTYPIGKGGFCSAFSLPHCHHHGPQGADPFPAEGTAGCPQQSSPQCPTKCDADSTRTFNTDKYTFSGQVQSASGEEGIQKAIMEGGPVETAFTVYTDFANYVSGIYHHVSGGVEGGHAVRIVGWGVDAGAKYWKVANSWNPYWGEKGYFRIKRGNSECGIEDGVTFSASTATWSKKN